MVNRIYIVQVEEGDRVFWCDQERNEDVLKSGIVSAISPDSFLVLQDGEQRYNRVYFDALVSQEDFQKRTGWSSASL